MILEVNEITKYFGGLCAISELSFHINEREIMGVIGPNGSGKTTLFNTITGVYKPDGGRIMLNGENITGSKAYNIVAKGIAKTAQLTSLFFTRSTLENVIMGMHCRSRAGVWGALTRGPHTMAEEKRNIEKAMELLEFLSLSHVCDVSAELISSAEQRRLMIGIALATQPHLLLLDEPTSGMSAEETAHVVDLIGEIRETGISILLIEHNMKVAMNICERIVAIESGAKIAEGPPEMIATNQKVIEAYLGKD